MPYHLVDVELSQPLSPLTLSRDQDGFGVVARWRGRIVGFLMESASRGSTVTQKRLRELVERRLAVRVLAVRAQEALAARWPEPEPGPAPALSIAICTKGRAARLERMLVSLEEAGDGSHFRSVEVIVVDSASIDSGTRAAVERFEAVRCVLEPHAGLDVARNAALKAARGDWIAFLDDDVVVDRGWLACLHEAWTRCPDAGGFTGLVLPWRLDTKAQIHFESEGGFGRGFIRLYHRSARFGWVHYPVNAGLVGAGCNMAFDRKLLLSLGGFDEALATGARRPAGSDLDMFYRVLRADRTIVYEPGYAVYRDHRETMQQLRRQYWGWGLGFMAFLNKARRTDPELQRQHAAMFRWWLMDKLGAIVVSALCLQARRVSCLAAELSGGTLGLLGGYARSRARRRRIGARRA